MKKLKDTKIGAFLRERAPDVLNIVGDLLPDKGVMGIVKNAIDMVAPDHEKEELKKVLEVTAAEYFADTQDAREMYEGTEHKQADDIANKVISYNLFIILGLVVVMVGVILYVEGPAASVISGLAGTAIGNLFQERNTVIGFFFGSSQGSKDKDK